MLTDRSRRRDFPGLGRMTYLNTAAEGIPPPAFGLALERYFRDKLKGMAGRDGHFREWNECRGLAGRMIGLTAEEVSLCSCSSEAYNLLAGALALGARDEVVVNDLDFPAGANPWLAAPCKVRLWKSRHGRLEMDDLQKLLNARTRLVQTSLVSFINGHRIDWPSFRDVVRRDAAEAVVSVDVTQAVGRVEFDCDGADCIISSTHKWLLGPHGGCIVGIPQRRSARLTSRAGGWLHLSNAFAADRFVRADRKEGAASFSVGMPNFPAVYALGASLRYIEAVGVRKIARHADPLVRQVHEGLRGLGIAPMCPHEPGGSGIVAFVHPDDAAIHAALLRARIHVMHNAGRLRVALHGYNTEADVERFLRTLHRILKSR
jgi:cysteine desulfurase/selenocysteine lyase